MKIKGNIFLVTGGASGLGAATVRTLSKEGGQVLIADLNVDAGQTLAKETGGRFIRCDVSSESDGQATVAMAKDSYGALHGLVNCAGIGLGERTVGKNGPHPLASFTKIINVNLIGSFNMIRLSAALMQSNKPNEGAERGVIVNTASVAAFDGQIGQAAYSASKGGIVGMTLPIARDLSRDGIRVVTIAPGLFLTPLLSGMPAEIQDSLGKQVPFPPRLGRPDEYAALARHIIENEMLNGETIRLDGAIRMAPK